MLIPAGLNSNCTRKWYCYDWSKNLSVMFSLAPSVSTMSTYQISGCQAINATKRN